MEKTPGGADGGAGAPGLAHPGLLRHAARVSLRKGRILYYQGDRADRAYLLLGGWVRRVLYRSNESTAELGRSGPGEWLGLAETFLRSLYLVDAVAESPVELLAFSSPGIERIIELPGMGAQLVGELARQLYVLHGRVEVNLPIDRTIRYLVDHAGSRGEVSATQGDVAEAVGLARETVNRHLAQLQSEGLLVVERGGVKLLDAAGLAGRLAAPPAVEPRS